MKVVFRVDASLQIGTGHVMRCLTLADALRAAGGGCTFICRPHDGHLLKLIAQRGHLALALPELKADTSGACLSLGALAHSAWLGTSWDRDAEDTLQSLSGDMVDWLVVDHYALDSRWEQLLRPRCRRLMVIDDLADRMHDCDILLDQSLGRRNDDYEGLLPVLATRLIGPQYALLRPEFARLRGYSLARRAEPKLEQLLITMGGVDKDNVTCLVLDALEKCLLPESLQITVVMGPHAPWLRSVQEQAARMKRLTRVLVGVDDIATLMAGCDLAIGAAGSTSWERCCLGVPTIQLVLAENQKEVAAALAAIGAVLTLDVGLKLQEEMSSIFRELKKSRLVDLASCAAGVCDGRAAPFVAEQLINQGNDEYE